MCSGVPFGDARGDVRCAELELPQCENLSFETTSAPVLDKDEHLIIRPATNKIPVISSNDITSMLNHFGRANKNITKVSFQNMILRPLDMEAISIDFSLAFEDVTFIEDTPHNLDVNERPASGPRGFSIRLMRSKVDGDLQFRRVTFRGRVELSKSFVGGNVIFEDVSAERPLVLNDLETNGRVDIGGTLEHQVVIVDTTIWGGLDLTHLSFVRSPVESILLSNKDDGERVSSTMGYPVDAAIPPDSDDGETSYCDCFSSHSDSDSAENCVQAEWLPLCAVSTKSGPYLIEIAESQIGGRIRLGELGLGGIAEVFSPPLAVSTLVKDLDSFLRRRPPTLGETRSWIRFHGVTGGADLHVKDLGADRLFIQQSALGRVSIKGGGFRWMVVANSSFSSFELLESDFYEWFYFKGNISKNGVNLQNFAWLPCEIECDAAKYSSGKFEVSGNRVEGNLVVRPLSFGLQNSPLPSDRPTNLPDAMELRVVANGVSGQLEVVLPVEAYEGRVAMEGKTGWYLRPQKWRGQHTIAINLARNKVASSIILGLSWEGRGFANDFSAEGLDTWPAPTRTCSVGVAVNIDAVAASVLEWNFPLSFNMEDGQKRCFQWFGGGFNFSDFRFKVMEDRKEVHEPWRAVQIWRNALARESPASLYPIAEYFSDQHNQDERRRITEEAKKLEYDGNPFVRLIFWPTGYGENPIRAIQILVLVYLLSVIYYSTMSEMWAGRWSDLFALREDLLRRDAMVQAAVARRGTVIAEQSVQRSINDLPRVMSRALGLEAEGLSARRDLLWVPVGMSISLVTLLVIWVATRQNVPAGMLRVVALVAAAFLLAMLLGVRILRRREEPPEAVITISFLGWLKRKFSEEEVLHLSLQPGFLQFDREKQPQNFSLFRYTLDVMVPLIDLHGYNRYYPADSFSRLWTMTQHLIGWWVLTSALAALADI